MEIFYSGSVADGFCSLDKEEAFHCFNVLRHREGDTVSVIDGEGTLMECRIEERRRDGALLSIVSAQSGFGGHNYLLNMAVAPTKNIDRYEWFLEKATEIGCDAFYPVIGDHSERKTVKVERCRKILLSAAKQSLKGRIPHFEERLCSVSDFIEMADPGSINLIAYCGDAQKRSIAEALAERGLLQGAGVDGTATPLCAGPGTAASSVKPVINILIGPEGDFSDSEVQSAISHGFLPVHLGPSRLRTETAAIVAVTTVYNQLSADVILNIN